jgi:hypothetical protein
MGLIVYIKSISIVNLERINQSFSEIYTHNRISDNN